MIYVFRFLLHLPVGGHQLQHAEARPHAHRDRGVLHRGGRDSQVQESVLPDATDNKAQESVFPDATDNKAQELVFPDVTDNKAQEFAQRAIGSLADYFYPPPFLRHFFIATGSSGPTTAVGWRKRTTGRRSTW